ncbi:MAG TPA: hypothetical protein VE869_15080 [Gemmatimonas sp.]|nr:hypothetical protein [Gemmatimonas sp.]
MQTTTLSISTTETQGMFNPPYAGPEVQAVLPPGVRTASRVHAPYVPRPWRGQPQNVGSEPSSHAFAPIPPLLVELPVHAPDSDRFGGSSSQATEYAASSDIAPPSPLQESYDKSAFYTPPFLDALPPIGEFLDSGPVGQIRETAARAGEPVRPDEWPFAEAGAETTELSAEFRPLGHEQLFADVPEPAPLPMWNDDDLMDIMPPPEAVRPAEETPHWTMSAADASVEESLQGTSSESAARALETLAARVRSGELRVDGYAPELGDAAVLAAALAALLGIRR